MTDFYAQMHGTYGNGDGWSTGLRITSNQTPDALLTTFSNAWIAAWTNGTYGLNTLYHTDTTTTEYTVAPLDGNMREVTKSVLTSITPGTSSDTALPNDNAIVVSLRSPYIGKSRRGRAFLPAPVEGIVSAGQYTSASMTRVKTAFQSVLTAIQADGSTVFVTNLKPLKDLTPAFRKTVITSILVARKTATQTRRTDREASNYV